MIVLHYTAMHSTEAALARLCAPEYEVSAHFLISERGAVYHLVDEEKRAWHAGAGCWGAVCDVNSHSIGIELANTGGQPFSELQMDSLEQLLSEIMARWGIPPERVIGHSDMAPGRKQDPGRRFDWQRLAYSGLSVWPKKPMASVSVPAPDPELFLQALGGFGYTARASVETLLSAFRLRFRPQGCGPLHPADMAGAIDLARRFPVDRMALNT